MNLRAVLVATIAVGVLAGCASGSSDAADPTTTSRSSSASTTTTAAATAAPGCSPDADAEPVVPGRSVVTMTSGGKDRSYVRYVPKGYDGSEPAPLVLDLTAYSPASLEESFSSFTKPDADGKVKADEVGAVVITPEPVNGAGLLTWNTDGTKGWTDDQQFVTDLLDGVEASTCVDPDRVLAMGFAIGAVMASTIACEQPERIAVLATVSGLWDPPGCSPSRPTPVISFHGDGDHFLPFDGGVGDHVGQLGLSPETTAGLVAMTTRPGAEASSQAWADRNGCDADPAITDEVEGVEEQAWSGCDDGADVELHVIDGGSHTWPGSDGMAGYEDLLGPVSHAIVANDVIWDFFEAHTS